MNGGFWLQFAVQVAIPGGFLGWLLADDVYRALRNRLSIRLKARRPRAPARAWPD